MNIGIFDSGCGGLSVLKAIRKKLPFYDYIYLGDNARAPYGDRSESTVAEFTRQGVEFLFREKNCHLIILACATASSLALRRLQQEWLPKNYPDRRILGVVIPLAQKIADIPLAKGRNMKDIGIIATRGTVASGVYERECAKYLKESYRLFQQACPLLVPLIEEGWSDTAPAKMILKTYLLPLKQKQVSLLVLGCTHYPLIQKNIQRIMGKRVNVLNPGPIIAQSLKTYLERHAEHTTMLSQKSTCDFFFTDPSPRAQQLFTKFWGEEASLGKATLE